VILALMVVEINNVKQQALKGCKYCLETGIGYEILVDILNYIPSTHVVKISTGAESKNLPTGSFWLDSQDNDSFSLIEIRSALRDSCNMSRNHTY